MKEVIVDAEDLVCLNKEKLQEIIRCKDCRWYAYKYDGYHSECDLFKMCFDQDDFCSRAERKEE